ncbi:hypothetical protein ACODG7_16790 [Vibrio anguillarum]|uniref:hypothetical protein n=1 Tax=Vibrio anguillarum TaxID=55601 RepID=UPI000366F647|nr:hypothetical protein [Vibrio anguillarum]OEE34145.1 hypothetical protein A1QW_18105 [Vibrio anguillarum]OEF91887.1 hypothetical protein A1QY_13905 [Vibrio anguillarum]
MTKRKFIYPAKDSDWLPKPYGRSRCEGVRFPSGCIFYTKRKDGSMRFAYVKDQNLHDSMGNVQKQGVPFLGSLVSSGERTWSSGELVLILPDTLEHVDAGEYCLHYEQA